MFKPGDLVRPNSKWTKEELLRYGFSDDKTIGYKVKNYFSGEYPSISLDNSDYRYDASFFELVNKLSKEKYLEVGYKVVVSSPTSYEGVIGFITSLSKKDDSVIIKDSEGCEYCFGFDDVEVLDKNLYKADQYTGGSSDYYKVLVKHPTTLIQPYEAEANDIIESLNMTFAEGNAFKAIWRKAKARQGVQKKGYDNGLYDSEKVVFFGERMVVEAKNK